jgi:hypothetical protein
MSRPKKKTPKRKIEGTRFVLYKKYGRILVTFYEDAEHRIVLATAQKGGQMESYTPQNNLVN